MRLEVERLDPLVLQAMPDHAARKDNKERQGLWVTKAWKAHQGLQVCTLFDFRDTLFHYYSEGLAGAPGLKGPRGTLIFPQNQAEGGDMGFPGVPGWPGDRGSPGPEGPTGRIGMKGFQGDKVCLGSCKGKVNL